MKTISIALLCIGALFVQATAQDSPISHKFGLGFQIGQWQKDFGYGLQMTSPYFANGRVAVRLKGNLVFHEHVENASTVWTPYGNISLGMVGVAGVINGNIRLYGEGGIIGLIPSDSFSTESFNIGGYGLFGFEFHMSSHAAYHIEIGGVGTGANADLVENEPIYSNGLLINTGFRYQF